jgi:hypothetical protein
MWERGPRQSGGTSAWQVIGWGRDQLGLLKHLAVADGQGGHHYQGGMVAIAAPTHLSRAATVSDRQLRRDAQRVAQLGLAGPACWLGEQQAKHKLLQQAVRDSELHMAGGGANVGSVD